MLDAAAQPEHAVLNLGQAGIPPWLTEVNGPPGRSQPIFPVLARNERYLLITRSERQEHRELITSLATHLLSFLGDDERIEGAMCPSGEAARSEETWGGDLRDCLAGCHGAGPHPLGATRCRAGRTWASSGLTDIHHQGFCPGRKDVHHGDHGAEAAAAPPVVHAGVQGGDCGAVPSSGQRARPWRSAWMSPAGTAEAG